MPTYEYECKKCSHRFEVFQSMSDEPVKKCPECGKEVRRLVSGGVGVIFKGSGFYVTDKDKSAVQKGKSASTGDGAKDAPAAKTDSAPSGGEGSKETPASKTDGASKGGDAKADGTKKGKAKPAA